MAPSREFVSLSEVANRWNRQENDLIDWAIQKQFNLYYYWRSPRGGMWVLIIEELGCFLRGEDSVSCSNYGIPIRPTHKVPFAARNEQPVYLKQNFPTIFPLYHTVSFPPVDISTSPFSLFEFPKEFKQIKKSDLFLHRDEIADMEGWYPSLIRKTTEKQADDNKMATLHPLEQESIAKLIYTMAVSHYQYNALANKSDAPKKIEQAAARAGISITSDTIRSWLQRGARLMRNGKENKK